MSRIPRAPGRGWDFEYHPLSRFAAQDAASHDFIVAGEPGLEPGDVAGALTTKAGEARVEQVLSIGPICWLRVRLVHPVTVHVVGGWLRDAGLAVRYVASARHGALSLGPALSSCFAASGRGDWRARTTSTCAEVTSPCWSHGPQGVCLDRKRFGQGAGTRLAVIDDDAADLAMAEVDAEVFIHVQQGPRAQPHGTLMVGWAVGTTELRGIAPLASPRLYCIPKPDVDIVSLPTAIVRAVADGADVILCPSYLEGTTSPMLDDALEFASRCGRGGRGTVVVVPTGREAASAVGKAHVSWSLGFAEPASDPRVLCVAPSSRSGGWFLWRERRGGLRPFANRGPAVRFLSPGDDMTSPLSPGATSHAESSGASAIAAGVVLLVLEANPGLTGGEVASVLRRTAAAPADVAPEELHGVVDLWDILPLRRDVDGHDAKHGYGRLHAQRACLSVSDPLAAALVEIGEVTAALRWFDLRASVPVARGLYSRQLGMWMARRCLLDDSLMHQLCAIVRHLRLVAGRMDRMHAHGSGALIRQAALAVRAMGRGGEEPSSACVEELDNLARRLMDVLSEADACRDVEHGAWRLATEVFSPDAEAE